MSSIKLYGDSPSSLEYASPEAEREPEILPVIRNLDSTHRHSSRAAMFMGSTGSPDPGQCRSSAQIAFRFRGGGERDEATGLRVWDGNRAVRFLAAYEDESGLRAADGAVVARASGLPSG
jgi:hypothetical protein